MSQSQKTCHEHKVIYMCSTAPLGPSAIRQMRNSTLVFFATSSLLEASIRKLFKYVNSPTVYEGSMVSLIH